MSTQDAQSDGVTGSIDYKHETACSLFDPTHQVNAEFVAVLERVAETTIHEVDVAATGCGTCFTTDADIGLYWVAQGDATETMFVGYGSNTDVLSDADVAELVVSAAEQLGVAVDWNGDVAKKVALGDSDVY